MLLATFTACDNCTDVFKAMVGTTVGTLAQIKTVAPRCTSNPRVLTLHHLPLTVGKKMLLALKNVLDVTA